MFEIINEKEEILELKKVEEFIKFVIEKESLQNCSFSIIITDNTFIHKLNKEYRNVDRPTDVISFALEDNKDIEYDNYRLLGDIYICDKKVFDQAKEYGHSVKRELSFLAVHGLLHLLGYDHMKPEDEKVMFGLQEEILDKYGIKR